MRPRKTGADYFSHDNGARNNRKIKALLNKFGLDGYAVYFMTLELLCEADGNSIRFDETEKLLIAGDFGIPAERLSEIWEFCFKLQLFILEDGSLVSESLRERLSPLYEKRERDRKRREDAAKRRKQNSNRGDNSPETPKAPTKTPQSKPKESKPKERKVNEETPVPADIDILGEKQSQLMKELVEFNAKRMEEWRVAAAAADVDLEMLQKRFINSLIEKHGDQYSPQKTSLIAGFDGYLLTTSYNQKKQNGKKRNGTNGVGTNVKTNGKFDDTSQRKPESAFED